MYILQTEHLCLCNQSIVNTFSSSEIKQWNSYRMSGRVKSGKLLVTY